MPTNVTWNGVSYSIPNAGELNWASLTNFLVALGTYAAVDEEAKQTIRVATTTPVSVVAGTDFAVVIDLTVPGASAVNLPAGVDGQIFIIVDGKGDAATNNITINPNGAETIGGSASIVMNKNRQVVMVQYHVGTTDWKLTNYSIPIGGVTPADFTGIVPASKGGTGVSNNDAATMTRSGNFDLTVTLAAQTDVNLGGDLTTGAALTTTPANAVTLTTTAATNVTLPTTGTLATLAGSETLSSKTLTAPLVDTSITLLDQAPVVLREDSGSGTNAISLQAPATLAADYTLNLPVNIGSSGQFLSTDGVNQLAWVNAGASGANVRGTEGAGTTTLTSSDNNSQVFNLSADRNVNLPTTGILAGAVYSMAERGASFTLQVRSSGSNNIVKVRGGVAKLVALVNTPTAASDWLILENEQKMSVDTSIVLSTGFGTPGVLEAARAISGNIMTLQFTATAGTVSGVAAYFEIPVGYEVDIPAIYSGDSINIVGSYYIAAPGGAQDIYASGFGGALTTRASGLTNALYFTAQSSSSLFQLILVNAIAATGDRFAITAQFAFKET